MINFIKQLILFLLIFLVSLALIPNLPSPLNQLNLILVFLIFISVTSSFLLGILHAFALGIFLDLYSGSNFGIFTFCLAATLMVICFIFNQWFTNKSLYALIGLTAAATILYRLLIYFFELAGYFSQSQNFGLIKQFSLSVVNELSVQIIANAFFSFLLFVVFHRWSRRFKAVYVETVRT